MMVQSVEPDTTVSLEEKDGASIPIQIPLGARYIEVDDLQGTFETSFHRARIITISVITLCMVFGSYIVIENRLYDVSFKFDRDGGMIVKRNLDRTIAEPINSLNPYSKGVTIEDSCLPSSTNQNFPSFNPSTGISKRSKSDEDERLVRLLKQRIFMLEKKLASFEADKLKPEKKVAFALFPALVSKGIPGNINEGDLDRHRKNESSSRNDSPSIGKKNIIEIFNTIQEFFSGLYRFIFLGGSIRIRQPEQNKSWIEYDKDVNILVLRFLTKDHYKANLAKTKQDTNSKERQGKDSADVKNKLKSEFAAVKRELKSEATELKKIKETEEARLKKSRAKLEADFKKKMKKEAFKSRKKVTKKQSELKKMIEEEEKAELQKKQKEEEIRLKRKMNQEADDLRRVLEKREKDLKDKIQKKEVDLVRKNQKLNEASDLIVVKEMKAAAFRRRLGTGATEFRDQQLTEKTRGMKQMDENAPIVGTEEVENSKSRGLFSSILLRHDYKQTSPEDIKSTPKVFFKEITFRRQRSGGEGKFVSGSTDSASKSENGKRFFEGIRFRRRSKSAIVHGPFYEKQSSVGNSWVSAIRFRRRHAKKSAVEQSYPRSQITEQKQDTSQTTALPDFFNYFFTGVFDGIRRIRLRSIRQIMKDPLTQNKLARQRSGTKQRLKERSSRTKEEPPNQLTMRLKKKKIEKKVPQYSAIRIRRVQSRSSVV